jgi:oligopeptide transport system substrate-binding protein
MKKILSGLAFFFLFCSALKTPILAGDTVEEFIMSNGVEPILDPTLMTDVPSTNVYLALFEGLVQYDPKTNLGIPGVAESWSVSPDGLKLTFKLRHTQWSDGIALTAYDFVYSMQRMLNPETGAEYAYMPALIIKGAEAYNNGEGSFEAVGVKALDDYTLEYTLTGPAPYAVDMFAHSAFGPVPKQAIEKWGNEWTKPGNIVTNGAYILEEWKARDYLLLKKNSRYWDAKNVAIQSIKILSGANEAVNYDKYKNSETDWNYGIDYNRLDEIKRRPDYHTSAQYGTYYYCFNVTRKPVDDVRVRKALAAAIEKQPIVDKLIKRGQLATDAWVPPMTGYKPQTGMSYNVAQAKKLLAEAGYPGGKGFPELTIVYNTNEGHKKIAEYIQQQWETNLGIEVLLKNMDFKALVNLRSNTHDFVVCRHGWLGDYLDPDTMLGVFATGGVNNDGLYSNPAFDALLKEASISSGAERMKLLEKADEILITKDQAIIPLYHYVNQDLIDTNKWGGWYDTPLGFHPWKFIYKK